MRPMELQEYPQYVSHPDGHTRLVHNEDELRKAVDVDGFEDPAPMSAAPQATMMSGYVPQEYPKCVYDGKGGVRTVLDADAEAVQARQGFVEDVNGPQAEAPPPHPPPAPPALEDQRDPELPPVAPDVLALDNDDLDLPPIVVPNDDIPKVGRPTKAAAAIKGALKKATGKK